MPLLFAPNLSMLWPDQPFAERLWPDQPFAERFGRAARAARDGFRAVDLWWPEEYRRRTP